MRCAVFWPTPGRMRKAPMSWRISGVKLMERVLPNCWEDAGNPPARRRASIGPGLKLQGLQHPAGGPLAGGRILSGDQVAVANHVGREALPHLPQGSQLAQRAFQQEGHRLLQDRKSTRLNSSHVKISYAVFCLKKKTITF